MWLENWVSVCKKSQQWMIPRQSHWRKNLTYHLMLQYHGVAKIDNSKMWNYRVASNNCWTSFCCFKHTVLATHFATTHDTIQHDEDCDERLNEDLWWHNGWLNHAESHSHCQVSTGQSEFHRFKIASFMKNKLDPWLDTTRGTRNDLANSFWMMQFWCEAKTLTWY